MVEETWVGEKVDVGNVVGVRRDVSLSEHVEYTPHISVAKRLLTAVELEIARHQFIQRLSLKMQFLVPDISCVVRSGNLKCKYKLIASCCVK